jgi:hypothetical protein
LSCGTTSSSTCFHTRPPSTFLFFIVFVLSGNREIDKKRRAEEFKVQELKEE